ncbi:NAD(P)/FAD-dependent oxidoreductase [Microbacterium oxydans]|uniref:Gamma-glutamylputrescine oxidoreductase n=1 Tax=Microbacterium oxydans TaxID=82380 RepID=A0A0F0L8S7_9MICO|nr:FAD-dependent oxidoreductase [Microbacterium oxydans]KJL29094.1 Gamma-glutamylputrescine oxidoreductase [Microbacterium oxydans]
MKMHSYWLDTATPSGDHTETPIPREVDVAVVGAGFTGLSTAYHAAKAGLSVAVLEANTVVWGASGRNGGMVTNGLGMGFRDAVARYGEAKAKEYIDLYNDAVDLIEQLVVENDLDVDFERRGKLILASKESHFEGVRKTSEALRRLAGHDTEVLDREQIRAEVGSSAFFGGFTETRSAAVHVAKFGHALAALAIREGASIHENAEVTDLRRIGSGTTHELVTTRGTIRAGKVVVGTSGYTGRPFGWLQRRVVPVGSFITVTEPLPKDLAHELLPNRRVATDTFNLLHYFRLTPDDRLLFGGRARFALSDPASDRKSGEILVAARDAIYPQLRDVTTEYMWGGLVDISMDRMVHAGERNGLFYSMAYSGHGVQMATYMGKVMADVVAGRPEANPWRDLKNPWIPGYFGNPWLHLRAGGTWYGLKDRMS